MYQLSTQYSRIGRSNRHTSPEWNNINVPAPPSTASSKTCGIFSAAPIEYDRQRGGYYHAESGTHSYELPGLRFNAEELPALLNAQRLLTGMQPSLLDRELASLCRRIETILRSESLDSGEIARRVRVISIAASHAGGEHFQSITVTRRIRLRLRYHGRARDILDKREVSLQRLVHYRATGYSTPGATHANPCATSPWSASLPPKHSIRPPWRSKSVCWSEKR